MPVLELCANRLLASASSSYAMTLESGVGHGIDNVLRQTDGPVGGPKGGVCLAQRPVLLLDRADLRHHFALEPKAGGIRVQASDDERLAVIFHSIGNAGGQWRPGRGFRGRTEATSRGNGDSATAKGNDPDDFAVVQGNADRFLNSHRARFPWAQGCRQRSTLPE